MSATPESVSRLAPQRARLDFDAVKAAAKELEHWDGCFDTRADKRGYEVWAEYVVMRYLAAAGDDPYYFGHALLKYCDVDDLPFWVRMTMGRAVLDVFQRWQEAGSPGNDLLDELKSLFPYEPTRAES